MRGRKPAPTELKILAGTRADRINDRPPEAPSGIPEPPEHLDLLARGEWDRVTKILDGMGLASKADSAALCLYCECYSKWLRARDEVRKRGLVIERDVINSKGTVTGSRIFANPAMNIETQMMRLMKDLLIEFGLTPSSRGRLKSTVEKPKDALEEFLAG